MASLRRSLFSGASSAIRICKSKKISSICGATFDSGSIGAHSTVSQLCGPKVNFGASRSAFAPSRTSTTPTPFGKCNVSGSIPGGRCFASHVARLPGEVAATLSLIPYYSAIAESRLVSRLGASGDASILQDNEDGT